MAGVLAEKTDAFNKVLKKNLEQYLNVSVYGGRQRIKLSDKQAMQLFKIALGTPLQFLVEVWDRLGLSDLPENYIDIQKLQKLLTLTVARVGVFKIHCHKPRRSRGRASYLHGRTTYVPQYKYNPARNIRNLLVREMTGLDATVKGGPLETGLKTSGK